MQQITPLTPIAERAVATIAVPDFVDFIVADGAAVWVTNRGRLEKLERGSAAPVATITLASR